MTDWLTELIGTPNKEYPAFMAGLSFLPALDPDDALAALRRRAEALTMKLVAMRGAMQAARRPGCRASSSSRPSTRSARSAPSSTFVTALVEEMESGTLEGLDMWRLFQTEDFNPEEVHFTFDLPKE